MSEAIPTYNFDMARKSSATISHERKAANTSRTLDTSDEALAALLEQLKKTVDPLEIRQLSDRVEQIVFHKQLTNA
jgi:hypothetical protein